MYHLKIKMPAVFRVKADMLSLFGKACFPMLTVTVLFLLFF